MQPFMNDYGFEKYSNQKKKDEKTHGSSDTAMFYEDRHGSNRSDRHRVDGGERSRRDEAHYESERSSRRSDRDRGERDRDRDRDRDKERERDRDRYSERDRDRNRERDYERRRERSRSPERRSGRQERERDSRSRREDDRYDYRSSRRHDDYRDGRKRSPSPQRAFDGMAPDPDERTPLEGRLRHLQNWDAAPKGFERISADKAKLLGIFPPPGNVAKLTNFVPPTLDPSLAAMLATLSGGEVDVNALMPTGLGAGAKQNRRLYVAGFPTDVTEDDIARYLNRVLGSNEAVLGVQISQERNYAFVDFKHPEDATLLFGQDGITWEDGLSTLRIRRPRDYTEETVAEGGEASGGVLKQISGHSIESDKFAFVNLPLWLEDAHIRAFLEPFGELKSCMLLTHPKTSSSLGMSIFAYKDTSLNQAVCDALNGLMMGDRPFSIRPVTDISEDEPELLNTLSAYNFAQNAASGDPSPVLVLLNTCTEEDLLEDYDGIYQDILNEASLYGTVVSLVIPKPSLNPEELVTGLGKVYVQYENKEASKQAFDAMNGRLFADRTIVAFYYDPAKFTSGILY